MPNHTFVCVLIASLTLSFSTTVCAAVMPVQTQVLDKQTFYQVNRRYAGKVSARRHSQLTSALSGIVEHVYVVEGDTVSEGQLLLSLDLRHLRVQQQQAQAQLASAHAQVEVNKANAQLAKLALARVKQLRDQGHSNQAVYDEAFFTLSGQEATVELAQANEEAAQAALQAIEINLKRSVIVAPFAGRVQRRWVDEGAALGPSQAALLLIETQSQQARFALPTQLFGQLPVGQHYTISIDGQEVEAQLIQILPSIDDNSSNMQIKLQFIDAPIFLDGAVAELHWQQNVESSGYWLPIAALTEAQRGLWSVLAVVKKDQQPILERRLVDVIHSEANRVFVEGTLAQGELIVVTGTQNLTPGQQVSTIDLEMEQ